MKITSTARAPRAWDAHSAPHNWINSSLIFGHCMHICEKFYVLFTNFTGMIQYLRTQAGSRETPAGGCKDGTTACCFGFICRPLRASCRWTHTWHALLTASFTAIYTASMPHAYRHVFFHTFKCKPRVGMTRWHRQSMRCRGFSFTATSSACIP